MHTRPAGGCQSAASVPAPTIAFGALVLRFLVFLVVEGPHVTGLALASRPGSLWPAYNVPWQIGANTRRRLCDYLLGCLWVGTAHCWLLIHCPVVWRRG